MTANAEGSSALDRAVLGGIGGAVLGMICLGVGAIRALVALVSGASFRDSMPPLGTALLAAALYCGGFAAAGVMLGALWPLRRTAPGAFGLGYLTAGIVTTAVSGLVRLLDPLKWDRAPILTVAILTLVFGTVAGYQIQRWDRS